MTDMFLCKIRLKLVLGCWQAWQRLSSRLGRGGGGGGKSWQRLMTGTEWLRELLSSKNMWDVSMCVCTGESDMYTYCGVVHYCDVIVISHLDTRSDKITSKTRRGTKRASDFIRKVTLWHNSKKPWVFWKLGVHPHHPHHITKYGTFFLCVVLPTIIRFFFFYFLFI